MSRTAFGHAVAPPRALSERALLGASALFVLLLLVGTLRSAHFLAPTHRYLLPALLLLLGVLAATVCQVSRFLLHREPAVARPLDGLPVFFTVAAGGATALAWAGFVELRLVVRELASAGGATGLTQLVEGLLRTSFASIVVVLVTLLISLCWLALSAPHPPKAPRPGAAGH